MYVYSSAFSCSVQQSLPGTHSCRKGLENQLKDLLMIPFGKFIDVINKSIFPLIAFTLMHT